MRCSDEELVTVRKMVCAAIATVMLVSDDETLGVTEILVGIGAYLHTKHKSREKVRDIIQEATNKMLVTMTRNTPKDE